MTCYDKPHTNLTHSSIIAGWRGGANRRHQGAHTHARMNSHMYKCVHMCVQRTAGVQGLHQLHDLKVGNLDLAVLDLAHVLLDHEHTLCVK